MPPWSDLAVLCGIVVSTGWWVVRLRRRVLREAAMRRQRPSAFSAWHWSSP